MNLKVFIFFILCGLFLSCSKEDEEISEPTTYSDVPEIKFERLESTELKAFQDSLILYFEYTDGDGDIGFDEPDSSAIYLTETKNNLQESFHIPRLSPPGETLQVKGTLKLIYQDIYIYDDELNEYFTTFKVRIRDRSGNFSNEIETPQIRIYR